MSAKHIFTTLAAFALFLASSGCNAQNKQEFTTHEGSGLANCVSDVKKAFPKATVTKGFSIYGHEVQADRDRSGANGTSGSGKAKVEKWLKGIGY